MNQIDAADPLVRNHFGRLISRCTVLLKRRFRRCDDEQPPVEMEENRKRFEIIFGTNHRQHRLRSRIEQVVWREFSMSSPVRKTSPDSLRIGLKTSLTFKSNRKCEELPDSLSRSGGSSAFFRNVSSWRSPKSLRLPIDEVSLERGKLGF